MTTFQSLSFIKQQIRSANDAVKILKERWPSQNRPFRYEYVCTKSVDTKETPYEAIKYIVEKK